MGCETELRGPFDNDFDLFSFSAIASEFARPVKYRKAAIGVAIHTDPDFDVVAAMLIGRDLQDQTTGYHLHNATNNAIVTPLTESVTVSVSVSVSHRALSGSSAT